MAENINLKTDNRGVALILTILIMSLLLFLGMYFISNSLTEKMIAKSQSSAVMTYYLAESGINEMIWKVINEPSYKVGFMYYDDWATSTTRIDPFGPGSGSYTVVASNTKAAHCDIVSIGSVDVGGGNFAQRIVKTNIFRAIGTSSIQDSAGYADGNITITNSYVNFLGGSAHSNLTFDVNNQNAQMFVDKNLRAGGNYLEHSNASTTIHGWIYSANWPVYAKGTGTAAEIDMPAIDFNSADPDSYKNQAIAMGTLYTAGDFDDLICSKMGSNLVLTKKVTYVEGSVHLEGPIDLVYPPTGGILIVEDDFIVGSKAYKQCGAKIYGEPNIQFIHVAGKPSGVLAGKKMQFLANTGDIDIEGVLYANAEMDLNNINQFTSNFLVRGGVISQKLDIDSCYGWPTIIHDNTVLVDTLGLASSSPTLIIEHWEEEY